MNRKNKTSIIYYTFDGEDIFIETINQDINLELYGDNHVTDKSSIYLYKSTKNFLSSLDDKSMETFDTPFLKYRRYLKKDGGFPEILLNDLYKELNFEKPKPLKKIDFEAFDKTLKVYGYRKTKKYLYLHLIVFCGEYLNNLDSKNSHWDFECGPFYPFVPIPIYVKNGMSTNISINHFLGKGLNEAEELVKENPDYLFKIEDILEFDEKYRSARNKISIDTHSN